MGETREKADKKKRETSEGLRWADCEDGDRKEEEGREAGRKKGTSGVRTGWFGKTETEGKKEQEIKRETGREEERKRGERRRR